MTIYPSSLVFGHYSFETCSTYIWYLFQRASRFGFEQLLSIITHELSGGLWRKRGLFYSRQRRLVTYIAAQTHIGIYIILFVVDRETRESFILTVVFCPSHMSESRVEFIVGVSLIWHRFRRAVVSADQFWWFQTLAIVHCELQIAPSLRK